MGEIAMPELLLHFAVPFAVSAPVLGVRRAFLVASVALIPDFDVLVHVHRSVSHSVLVLGLGVAVALALAFRLRRGLMPLVGVCGLALLGHPVMDMFQTLTPILYPVVNWSVCLDVRGRVLIGEVLKPVVSAETKLGPTVFKTFQSLDAPIFTSEGFIISTMLVAVPILMSLPCRPFRGTVPQRSPEMRARRSNELSASTVSNDDPPLSVGRGGTTPPREGTVPKSDVTVVIPTLNEAGAIGRVIGELKGLGYDDILVVDGYSSDGTRDIATRSGARVVQQHGVGTPSV